MTTYVIRRLLLMIPTFIGITFMVFFILQVAPDGPFERAVKQLKDKDLFKQQCFRRIYFTNWRRNQKLQKQ